MGWICQNDWLHDTIWWQKLSAQFGNLLTSWAKWKIAYNSLVVKLKYDDDIKVRISSPRVIIW